MINVRPDGKKPAKKVDLVTANIHGTMKEGQGSRPGTAKCCDGCSKQVKAKNATGPCKCAEYTAVVDFSSGSLGKVQKETKPVNTDSGKRIAAAAKNAKRRAANTDKQFAPRTQIPNKPITMVIRG